MQNLKKILSVALAGVILTLSFSTVLAAPRDIIDTVTGEQFLYEEYSKSADKFKELLNKVGSEDAKLTYEYDGVVFNFEKLDSFVATQVAEGKSFTEIMEVAKTDESLIEKDAPVEEELKVVGVSAITTTDVTVTFEALKADKTGATVEVKNPAGEVVAVVAQDLTAGATEATFAFETELDKVSVGTWTVDGKEFVQEAVATTVEVEAVSIEENKTATPIAKVLDQDGNEIADQVLTYSIDKDTVATVAKDGTITAGAYVVDKNTATLTATLGEGESAITGTAVVTVTEDTTLPTATVKVIDAKHIKVSFSEEVQNAGTITSNYKLVKTTDLADDLFSGGTGESAVVAEDGKSVMLRIEDTKELVPAQYVLTLNVGDAGTVADLAGNKIYKDTEIIFTPEAGNLADVTAPELQTAAYDSSTRELELTFNENVTSASYDATKVTFAGVQLKSADSVVVAQNVATITLSQATADALDLTNGGDVVLTEAIADAAGNKVTVTKAVTIVTPPTLVDAEATGSSFDETTRILTVKFNEAVTLKDITQISLDNNADAAQAFVAADKVILGDGTDTLKIQLSNTTYDKIKDNAGTTVGLTVGAGAVADLEGTANKAIAKVEIAYAQDEVAPEITGATYNNQTKVLTITANEELDSLVKAEFSIDTKPTTGAITLVDGNMDVNAVIDGNTIVATLNSASATTVLGWLNSGKTVKVFTTADTAVKDLAGNNVGTIALADGVEVEIVDQIAPEIAGAAVDTLSGTKFALTFNEVMDKATTETAANYVIYDNQNDKNIEVTKAELQADGVTVFLTTSEALGVPNVNNYVITVNNVRDLSLNRIANNSTKVFTLGAVDTTAPTLTNGGITFTAVAGRNNDTIGVVFTETGSGLDKASAENLSNYVLKDAAGTVISLTGAKASLAGTTVTITLENGYNLQTGADYTLDVANVMDKAENVMEAFTGTAKAAVGDNVAPTISSIVGKTTPTGDQVEIFFSEAVQKSLAEDIANYTIKTGSAYGTTVADADAKTIVYTELDSNDDGSIDTYKVRITYAADTLDTNVQVTSETGIKDLAGNAMVAGSDKNSAVVDGVAPEVETATITTAANENTDTIKIVFDEVIVKASAIIGTNPINLVVKDSQGNVIDLSAATAVLSQTTVSNDTLTITLDNGTDQLKTGETYTIEIDGIMDAAGNETVATKSVVATGDETAPTFTIDGNMAGNDVLVITMSEDINESTLVKGDFLVQSSANGLFTDTVNYVIASISYNAGTKKLTINLTSALPAADTTAKVKVTVLDTNGGFADLAGNVQDEAAVAVVID